jgi:hypothetical protein
VWWRNRPFDAPSTPDDRRLPPVAARVTGGVGVLALAVGVFLFVAPAAAIKIWPWLLTPLTSRVLGAVFCLGLAGIGALIDPRWSSARLPMQVAMIMLTLMVLAGLRAHHEFDTGNPLTWLFAVGFVGLDVGIASLYLRMERSR